MRYYLWAIAALFLSEMTAQSAHLTFRISGFPSDKAVLGYYNNGDLFSVDTTTVDQGAFRFDVSGLKPGLYYVADFRYQFFDFVVTHPLDSFLISGDIEHLDSLSAEHSAENSAFFKFEHQRKTLETRISGRMKMRDLIGTAAGSDTKTIQDIESEIAKLYRQIDSVALDYRTRNARHLYARMLRSIRTPEPPDNLKPTLKNGQENPAFKRWIREHYFDNTDFNDERLLRNHFWSNYFDQYFSRVVPNQVDSIENAIRIVIGKMPKNGPFYRACVSRLTRKFEASQEPWADRLFVFMADEFHKKNDTPWLDIATLERVEYKASVLRPTMTGKVVADLNLNTPDGKTTSLHALDSAYTLLIFYSPLCQHCMEILPDVYQTWLDARRFGLGAFVVSTDDQPQYWKSFVQQQNWEWTNVMDMSGKKAYENDYHTANLPNLYLLDRHKRMVRRINPKQLRENLKVYLKNK